MKAHQIFHIHCCNCLPILDLGGENPICQVIEVSYIKREGTFKYIYACITEDSVMIPETDYQPNSHWIWSNPSGIYAYMFRNRNSTFSYLEEKKEKYELFIPQEVSEKYSYFKEWLAANSQSKDLEISIPKEYKKYLKEHK